MKVLLSRPASTSSIRTRAVLVALCLLLPTAACSDRILQVVSDPASTGGRDEGTDGEEGRARCPGGICACNDGLDNDDDGVIDGFDPECLGPFDNDESTFGEGLGAADPNACGDCFFDGNRSASDDGCSYGPMCARAMGPPMTPVMPNPECGGCSISAGCYNSCRPRTPNGCDCFGCCEVYDKGKRPERVLMVAGCSLDNLEDEEACPRCKPTKDCRNECGECELCIGKGPGDLSSKCAVDGGVPDYTCGDGPRCSDAAACNPGFYCQLGCCVPILD